MSDLLTLIVTGLLGGGLVGGVASLITGHALARKTNSEAKGLDAKLPAEIDSVVVQGAESAVLTMRSALESATARIKELETNRENDRKRIGELELKVEELRGKVEAAELALGDARRAGTELRAELEEFVRDRGRRA